MSKSSNTILIILLGILTAVGPFSIDMYLPGMDAIAKDFGTPISNVQLTLTSFFFGISFGQLFYGPIIDRFGRKTPLIYGLILYIVSSLACALSDSVWSLVFFRFLQSLGACAGMVIPRAVVRDVFSPHEGAKVFSQILLVMGVAPIVAPSVGGILLNYANWNMIFYALALISALTLLLSIYIFDDKKGADHSISLKLGPVLKEYAEVFKNPIFRVYVLTSGFAASVMFAYIGGSPFVFMVLNGLTKTEYSLVFSFNAFGLILFSQINRLLLKKFEAATIVRVVVFSFIGLSVCLVASSLLGFGFIPMLFFIFLLVSAFGLIVPNCSALAMAPFSKNAGSASALMGALQMVFGAVATAAVSILHDGTEYPMLVVMGTSGLLALACFYFLGRKTHKIKES
ncbi:Bcr/CflA family efflux MFS transporter [Leptospira semungkisensis]|uniref:Bcr/CflA family efflux MFS transporter n=1 Tax=Leptospira semungkisensis TaxID=2484985 RepID=A0A4R9G818_9LEPT|nr:multidrug effflux MFS transporter [Leptospira semungkisensis]TGK07190.1 Bcr/CflA family efflux MFS transporter [Leptospira semungkisensis]